MAIGRTRFRRIIKAAAAILLVLAIAGYAAWRSLPYAKGPSLHVFQPLDGATISSTTVELIGRADRINSLSLNGYPISIDEEGNFRRMLVVFDGVNVITLTAKDQFGRSAREEVRIVGVR